MEDTIDLTPNDTESDSFMTLEIGMSDHFNDAATLCPPQRVYNPRMPPH